MCIKLKITLQAAAACETFYFTGKTLLSDVPWIVRPDVACVWPEVGSATKSLSQCCRIFIELNFLEHAADIGDNWLQVQPPSTSVAEQL